MDAIYQFVFAIETLSALANLHLAVEQLTSSIEQNSKCLGHRRRLGFVATLSSGSQKKARFDDASNLFEAQTARIMPHIMCAAKSALTCDSLDQDCSFCDTLGWKFKAICIMGSKENASWMGFCDARQHRVTFNSSGA